MPSDIDCRREWLSCAAQWVRVHGAPEGRGDAEDGEAEREWGVSEAELLSFLALEGAELQLKFDALTTEDVAARLAVALSVLDGRRKLLAAKSVIKSLGLSWGAGDADDSTR